MHRGNDNVALGEHKLETALAEGGSSIHLLHRLVQSAMHACDVVREVLQESQNENASLRCDAT